MIKSYDIYTILYWDYLSVLRGGIYNSSFCVWSYLALCNVCGDPGLMPYPLCHSPRGAPLHPSPSTSNTLQKGNTNYWGYSGTQLAMGGWKRGDFWGGECQGILPSPWSGYWPLTCALKCREPCPWARAVTTTPPIINLMFVDIRARAFEPPGLCPRTRGRDHGPLQLL